MVDVYLLDKMILICYNNDYCKVLILLLLKLVEDNKCVGR